MKKSIMPAAMAEMTLEDLLKKLVENQSERQNLFQALKGIILKKTDGASGFKDDNSSVPKYWLKVAQDYADDLLPPNFDLADFGLKSLCFEDVVSTKQDDDLLIVGFRTLRNIISEDAFWYSMFVMKQVKEKAKKNPVFDKIMKNAPVIRAAKSTSPTDPPPTDPPPTDPLPPTAKE